MCVNQTYYIKQWGFQWLYCMYCTTAIHTLGFISALHLLIEIGKKKTVSRWFCVYVALPSYYGVFALYHCPMNNGHYYSFIATNYTIVLLPDSLYPLMHNTVVSYKHTWHTGSLGHNTYFNIDNIIYSDVNWGNDEKQ